MRPVTSFAVLLAALLFAPTARSQESLFIQSLQVRGSGRPVELETHAGQRLDRARLERDLRRLWATGWFDDVRIESAETPEGLRLVFTLAEKPRLYLRRVRFEPEGEKRPLALQPGTALDATVAKRVAALLRQRLVEEGHADAQVEAELVPAGFQEADLLLRLAPGPRYRVEEIRFSGNPGLDPDELQAALRATRVRRPFLVWTQRPPFSQQAVEADLERLRSLYLSRGYFRARLALRGLEFAEEKATVTVEVNSGPRFRVERVEIAGAELDEDAAPDLEGNFSPRALCRCLLEAQRAAETEGALDFSARLEIEPSAAPAWAALGVGNDWVSAQDAAGRAEDWVALTARVEAGPPMTVARIEFRGHHSFSDLTLRRAWKLEEGELFDRPALLRSLAALNRLGFFEPVTEEAVALTPTGDGRSVHLTVALKEKPRGRWALSGPLGPVSLAGPLQLAVGSRLPPWGQGALELSTYYGTVSLLGFSQPGLRALSLLPQTRWAPLLALERPILPGQSWQSGFLLAPQLGWRGTLAGYALAHARTAAENALPGDPAGGSSLAVPVRWEAGEAERAAAPERAGFLLCEAPAPRWRWLRSAAAMGLEFLLARPLL